MALTPWARPLQRFSLWKAPPSPGVNFTAQRRRCRGQREHANTYCSRAHGSDEHNQSLTHVHVQCPMNNPPQQLSRVGKWTGLPLQGARGELLLGGRPVEHLLRLLLGTDGLHSQVNAGFLLSSTRTEASSSCRVSETTEGLSDKRNEAMNQWMNAKFDQVCPTDLPPPTRPWQKLSCVHSHRAECFRCACILA